MRLPSVLEEPELFYDPAHLWRSVRPVHSRLHPSHTHAAPPLCFGLQLSPLLPPANEILFHPKFLAQKSPALGYFQTPKQTTALPLPVLLCLLPCASPGWTGRSLAAGQNLVYSPMNLSLLSLLCCSRTHQTVLDPSVV